MLMSPRRTLLRNLLAVTLPEFVWGFGSALTIESPIPAAFRGYLCGGEWFLGAWTLVGALASAAAMLLTSWFVQGLARKRAFVVVGHLVTGALYLPVILLARALGDGESETSQLGALVGYGLFALSLGFLMPAWMALIGALFPEGQRARVLGLVFACNRIGGVLGGLAAEAVLRSTWNPHDQWTWLWGVAAGMAMLGALPFLLVVEPEGRAVPRPSLRAHLGGLLGSLRRLPDLRRFVAVDLLVIAGFVVLAYYGDMALDVRGLPPESAGRLTAVSAGAQLAGALLVALAGAWFRPRRVLAAGALAAAGAALLTCVASTPFAFAGVAALTGLFLVSRQTCHGPQVMRLAGAGDPTASLALAMAVGSLGQALLPFAAGALRPVTGFPPVFVAVAVLTLLGALLLLIRVGDTAAADVPSP